MFRRISKSKSWLVAALWQRWLKAGQGLVLLACLVAPARAQALIRSGPEWMPSPAPSSAAAEPLAGQARRSGAQRRPRTTEEAHPEKHLVPVAVGPIPKAAIDYKPSKREHASRMLAAEEDSGVGGIAAGDRVPGLGGRRGGFGGGRGAGERSGERLGEGPGAMLFSSVLGAVPILRGMPIKPTGRGIGFDLGSWNDVGFAFELPRIARVGSQTQAGSELSAPMVSLNYKF